MDSNISQFMATRGALRALATGIALVIASAPLADAHTLTWPFLRAGRGAQVFPQPTTPLPAASMQSNATMAGQVLPVTNCHDDGPGSLRAVVTAAADHDTVDLSALTCSSITLSSGAIAVGVDNLTLQGPGAARLAIDGGGLDRVFFDRHGGDLIFRDLTIRHGTIHLTTLGITGGACIADAGYLTLERSVVRDCIASAEGVYGGGVNAGVLTMLESTITGNTAYGDSPGTGTAASGGGAYAVYAYLTDSTITGNFASHRADPPRTSYDIGGGLMVGVSGSVVRSTIDHNTAASRGGGIFSIDDLVIDNSTLSANTAQTESGGGLFMRIPGILSMNNSTVSGNSAADGGGITLSPNGGSLQSSIVFGNTASAGAADLSASKTQVLAGDHNILGAAGPKLTLPADTLHSDPQLVPLAANGGFTRTQALPANSPAVDQGSNPSGASVDQRGAGYPRVIGTNADIGSFEWAALPLPATTAVPSLSPWAAWWLTLGSLGLGAITLRRRRHSTEA
ncbi:MAG: hypothetical protein L0H70_07460 [Xanthomonadales bacterium]|nr:hypothetical protein [Xanthomonadales bacterium]